MNNGEFSKEVAEKLLGALAQVDGGNETVMTEIFTRFINLFPEHDTVARRIYEQQCHRPFNRDRTV